MRKWLIEKRKAQKITQHSLACSVLISRAHYTNIEHGTRRPSYEVAKRIASILGFDWTLFFENESES
jgi:transcriptional regulator with XRE-family HTH domain